VASNSPHRPSLLLVMGQTARSLYLVLPLLGAAVAPAAAEAPFAPFPNPPDYIVTMAERRFQSEEPSPRIVRHQGGWIRVDRVTQPFGTATHFMVTNYLSADGKTQIRVYKSDLSVQMVLGGEPSPWRDTTPRNTGERRSHLGESCTVWEAWRVPSGPGGGLTHLSCVTDDGIELWHKSVGRHGVLGSAEATRVERRPVAPEEVRPALRSMLPDWWAHEAGEAVAPAPPDHETVMKSEAGAVRTTRRHGGWQSVEETANGVLQLRISHSGLPRLKLDYVSNTGAPKQLSITRLAPSGAELPRETPPLAMNQTETVLGESCRWYDMWPGVMDAGLHLCRTDDGIVLKETRLSMGSTIRWTAVRLTRRPVGLDEIKLPEILRDVPALGSK